MASHGWMSPAARLLKQEARDLGFEPDGLTRTGHLRFRFIGTNAIAVTPSEFHGRNLIQAKATLRRIARMLRDAAA